MFQSKSSVENSATSFTGFRKGMSMNEINEILNHPKFHYPPKNVFIEQVLDFLTGLKEEEREEYIPLLSYVDFSIASLQQLNEFFKLDKDHLFEDLGLYMQIRQKESDSLMKNEYIEHQQAKTAFTLAEIRLKSDELTKSKSENRKNVLKLRNFQKQINCMENEMKSQQEILNKRKEEISSKIKESDHEIKINPRKNHKEVIKDLEAVLNSHRKSYEKKQEERKIKAQQREDYEKKATRIKQIQTIQGKIKQTYEEQKKLQAKYAQLEKQYNDLIEESNEIFEENPELKNLIESDFQKLIVKLCKEAKTELSKSDQKASQSNKYYQAEFVMNKYDENLDLSSSKSEGVCVLRKIMK